MNNTEGKGTWQSLTRYLLIQDIEIDVKTKRNNGRSVSGQDKVKP